MSIRSAAAAALCAALPAAALAQPSPVQSARAGSPHPPPVLTVERAPAPGVTPASAVVRAEQPQAPRILPGLPPPDAQPAPAPQPMPAPMPAPKVVPAAAPVEVPPKPAPVVVETPPLPPITVRVQDRPAACGPDECAWGQFEWLYWAGSGQATPPLITVSPPDTPRAAAGVLGQPTTITQFGGNRRNNDFRDGFRFTGGWWSNPDRTRGVEADFFFLSRSREAAAASSDGSVVLARPYVSAGVPAAELVSFPGEVAGSVTAEATNRVIGGGISRLHNLCCDPCGRVDLLLGFRYLHVGDTVSVTETETATGEGAGLPAGTAYSVNDRFATSNDFYGGVIGLTGERRKGAFFYGGRASVALGGVVQSTTIDGSTVIGGVAQAGGLLARPSTIGTYRSTAFAVVPEFGVRVGFQVTDAARVYGAYNFIYLSSVARAGEQIDPAASAFPDRTTDFWLQGVSMGLELRY
ncbi:MAG: BBP7 family outer membrane beta-barrel protein [Gemmataceae bacterium]